MKIPGSRLGRLILGAALIIGGTLGFLPILGFWMVPLGLIVLSVDFPTVRRWRRKVTLRAGSWVKRKFPHFWKKYISPVANSISVSVENDPNKNS